MIQLGIFLLGIAAVPYIIYVYGITFGKNHNRVVTPPFGEPLGGDLPPISIVISAYNEEKNIVRRIENLLESDYKNMEIVVIDDCSTDDTCGKAWGALEVSRVPYQLSRNDTRMGTSASYNKAIKMAKHDLIVATDADTLFKPDAIYWIIGKLKSNDMIGAVAIGAVTGDLQPYPDHNQVAKMESEYRSVYGKMCGWESAHDSTFNFNGALMAFKRDAVGVINAQKGADDANIAFAAIRNGYRAVYEASAVVYETTPQSFRIQFRQKIRRASGLLNAMWSNRDLLWEDRPFARFFFYRMWMYFISPAAFFVGIFCDPYLLIATAISMFVPFFRSFILNQFYLLAGLITINRNVKTWESTSSLEGK